jgi:hypothetical protein
MYIVRTTCVVLIKEIMYFNYWKWRIQFVIYWLYQTSGIELIKLRFANSSGRAIWGVGLRSLDCWVCGFESLQAHGYLCLVSHFLCVELITCPDEFYRVWCVWAWSWSIENRGTVSRWKLLMNSRVKRTAFTKYLAWCEYKKDTIITQFLTRECICTSEIISNGNEGCLNLDACFQHSEAANKTTKYFVGYSIYWSCP